MRRRFDDAELAVLEVSLGHDLSIVQELIEEIRNLQDEIAQRDGQIESLREILNYHRIEEQ